MIITHDLMNMASYTIMVMLSNIGRVIFQRTRIWRLLAAWLVSRKAYILSYSTDKMSSEIYAQKNSFDPIICIVFLIIQHNSQRYTIMWMCTYEKWRSNSKICSHWGTTKIITLVCCVLWEYFHKFYWLSNLWMKFTLLTTAAFVPVGTINILDLSL